MSPSISIPTTEFEGGIVVVVVGVVVTVVVVKNVISP